MEQYIVKELLHFCNINQKGLNEIKRSKIDFYDFSFLLKGEIEYIINGERVILRENDAILLPPGTYRERRKTSDDLHFVSFNFIAYEDAVPSTKCYLPETVNREMRLLCAVFSEKHISSYYHHGQKMTNILNCLLLELFEGITFRTNDENVVAILKYIEANLTSRITLPDISAAVHLSKDYIAHIFKKELGKPIVDYVNGRRMQIAKNMIGEGKYSLVEISDKLGYTSYSYFSRVFKHYYGVSPIKYK